MNADIILKPLSPYKYSFVTNQGHNEIEYYFIQGEILYNEKFYNALESQLVKKFNQDSKIIINSIYVYKETKNLNEFSNHNRAWLDGENKNLVAFIRFTEGKCDIFYIIHDGNVIYDAIDHKHTNFEFDQ